MKRNKVSLNIFDKILDVFTWLSFFLAVLLALATIFASFSDQQGGKEIFGVKMFIVKTDSMSTARSISEEDIFFNAGDLIFVKSIDDIHNLKSGDVISFLSLDKESYGQTVTHKISVTDAYLGNHSWYSGGLIGWAEGDVKLINCDIDASSVVSSQWGDFNNANGGLIGGIDSTSTIYLKDCDVACVIDAYNDVTSAYEWYSYRSCGMLIGDSSQMDDPDGDNVGNAIAPNLTCENVTVTYGDWANYHYCQFNSSGYPFCRVEAGESTGAYGNARVGKYYDANGNEVVDDNHVHNVGEKHNELIVFDQLYGGEGGDRYCTYGAATHDGVTVIYNNK